MNNTQRKYFVKRIDEISSELIKQAIDRVEKAKAEVKTPGDRLKEWWAKASQKDRRQAMETLVEISMEFIGNGCKSYQACIIPSFPVEIGKERAYGILPLGNLLALNYRSEISALETELSRCVASIKKRGFELKDKVVFGADAESMCSMLKEYEHLCDNVPCKYCSNNKTNNKE